MTMSDVTNIVVQSDLQNVSGGGFLRNVDRWLRIQSGASLRSVSHKAGGNKNMEVCLSAGAFNHLDWRSFLNALPGMVDDPDETIIVIVTTQDDQVHTWRNKSE